MLPNGLPKPVQRVAVGSRVARPHDFSRPPKSRSQCDPRTSSNRMWREGRDGAAHRLVAGSTVVDQVTNGSRNSGSGREQWKEGGVQRAP